MYKIKFESENYFFYFNNLILIEDYHDKNKVIEVVNALDNYFYFKLTEILYIDDATGIPETLYKVDNSVILPNDKDKEPLITYKFIYRSEWNREYKDYLNFVGGFKNSKYSSEESIKDLTSLYNKYFLYEEYYSFKKIEFHRHNGIAPLKYRKKRNVGKQWGLSHQDSYGSEIEKLLGNELQRLNINFKIQQKIFGGSKLMTIPDFYIEEANLVIYCDGFQYHYDKDTVIKDRQQDRRLQYMDYKVLRFTGSEIVGDVNKCANEIKYFIDKFKNK